MIAPDELIRSLAVIASITSRGDEDFFVFANQVECFIGNIEYDDDDDDGGTKVTPLREVKK
jgi:hypothetical protein